MPKMRLVKGPITPPLLRFIAAVYDSNGFNILVHGRPTDYPPTDDQIEAFLRCLGYNTNGWLINERSLDYQRFNLLWLGSYSATDDPTKAAAAWQHALDVTCGDNAT